jgi:hypothetical protein
VKGQILGGTSAASTVYSATGGGSGICAGAVGGTQVIVMGPNSAGAYGRVDDSDLSKCGCANLF